MSDRDETSRIPIIDRDETAAAPAKEYIASISYGRDAEKTMPAGPYYQSIRKELERRANKLHMEIQLIEATLDRLTPAIEDTLIVAKNLEQLGMKTRL